MVTTITKITTMTTDHWKPLNTIQKKSGRQASEPPWLQHHTKKISTYRRQKQQQNKKHCHKYTKPETYTHSATHIHSLSLSLFLSTLLKTNTAPKINVITKATTQETCDWVRLSQTAEWSTPSLSLPHPLLLEKGTIKTGTVTTDHSFLSWTYTDDGARKKRQKQQ